MAISREEFELLRQAAELGLLRSLNGAHFSLTGKLSMTRDDIVKLIRACNGVFDEHPRHGTRYLIVGNTMQHGFTAKMRDAEARGTKVIYEDDFVRMIQPSSS